VSKLGFEYSEEPKDQRVWVGAGIRYYSLLHKWWEHFGLKGNGLMIGETGAEWRRTHEKLKEIFPEIEGLLSVDMHGGSDIAWDITYPFEEFYQDHRGVPCHFIVCQSVLEHVVDPYGAVKNLAWCLAEGGILYIHTHGPEAEEHRYPIDCYRFMKDTFTIYSYRFKLEILDMLWSPKNCFVVYRKN